MDSRRPRSWGAAALLAAIAVMVLMARIWIGEDLPRSSRNAPGAGALPGERRGPRGGLFVPLGSLESKPGGEPGRPVPAIYRDETRAGARPSTFGRREVLCFRLVSPEGEPVTGARVVMESQSSASDARGRVVIPRESGKLLISHRDYFPREVEADSIPTAQQQIPLPAAEGTRTTPVDLPIGASLVLIRGAIVAGSVRDQDGRPVSGARIFFGRGEAPPGAATGLEGAFESPLLPSGPVCVLVTHPTFQPASRFVDLDRPGVRARWDLTLRSGARLVVEVMDERGEPLPDAEAWVEVEMRDAPRQASSREWRFLGRAGDLGTLETRREPGSATIRVSLAGYRDATKPVEGERVEVTLRPGPAARGWVIDADSGLPVRIKDVQLEMLREAEFESIPDRGRLYQSLEAGRFVVGLPAQPGSYRLAVLAEGATDRGTVLDGRSEPFETDGIDSPQPIIVRLEARNELRGTVIGPGGPSAGTTVELCLVPPLLPPDEEATGDADLERTSRLRVQRIAGVEVPAPLEVVQETRTAEGGRFTFHDLHPGTYRLRVRAPGMAEHLSPPFAAPWTGDYPITLRRPAALAGTLYGSESLPEPDVPILLARGDEPARLVWTDGNGRFHFTGLAPGDDYRLIVGDAGGAGRPSSEPERGLAIEEGKDLTYDLRRPTSPYGSVDGRVEVDGAAAAGVHLRVVRNAPANDSAASDSARLEPGAGAPAAVSGANGEFLLRGLEPGIYRIESPEAPLAAEVKVEAGRRARVELSARTLRCRLEVVEAATGLPFAAPPGIEMREEKGRRAWRSAPASGIFLVRGLVAGRHVLTVSRDGLLLHEEVLDVSGDVEKTISLQAPHEVAVDLHVEGGEPFRGDAEVILEREGRELYRQARWIDGGVRVATPGVGIYELTVRSADRTARLRVEVTEALEKRPAGEDN